MTEQEKMLEQMMETLSKYGTGLERSSKLLDEYNRRVKAGTASAKDMAPVLDRMKDSMKNASQAVKEEAKVVQQAAADKRRQARQEGMTFSERRKLVQDANKLDAKATTLTTQLTAAQGQYKTSLVQFTRGNILANVFKTVAAVGAEYVKGSAAMAFSLIRDVQAQTDSIAATSKLLQLQLERNVAMTTAGIDGIANILGPVSNALVGSIADIAKSGVNVYSKITQEGYQALSAELEKTKNRFVELSAQGAFFANGMTGMRIAARNSSLRIDDYSTVIRNSADSLRKFGETQTDAMARVGAVVSIMDKAVQGSSLTTVDTSIMLRNLGYSVTEISEGTADYLSNLAVTGQYAGKSQMELAKGSFDYLTNLKLISALTGEDIKDAQKRARAASTQTAVFSKLANMGGDATAQFESLVRMMPGFETELGQMLTLGMTDNAALINSPVYEVLREAIQKIGTGVSANDLAAQTQDRLQATRGAQMENIQSLEAVGLGGLMGITSEFGTQLQALQSVVERSAASGSQVLQALSDQASTTDEKTLKTMQMQEKFEAISRNIENKLVPALTAYTESLNSVLAKTQEYTDIALAFMLRDDRGAMEKILPQFFGDNRTGDANTRRKQLEASELNKQSESNIPEAAQGGVFSGPTSGYKPDLIMHGKEAIIPLGKKGGVPVENPSMDKLISTIEASMASGGTNIDMTAIIEKLTETNRIASAQVATSNRMVAKLQDNINISKQILSYTR